jgi:hypothetical protein
MQLHRSIRRHASAKTDILLAEIENLLSVASRPARELTVRSVKPGIKSALDANCTDGDASLMITAQQRRHPHRQGLAAGALSG